MLRNAFAPLLTLSIALFPAPMPAQQDKIPPSNAPAAVTTPNAPPAERKQWLRRMQKYEYAADKDPNFLYDFARANPDMIRDVLTAKWKALADSYAYLPFLQILANGTIGEASGLEAEPGGAFPTTNPYLLDFLALGMQDKNRYMRGQMTPFVTAFSGVRFDSPEAFKAWRDAQKGKALEVITQEGMRNLALRFAKADAGEKDSLLDTLHEILPALRSQPASDSAGKGGEDLAATHRRALREAGLLDALIPLLQDKADPERPDKALEVLAALRPDAATLARIEPEARRLLEARFRRRDTLTLPMTDLLLACRSEGAMPLLVRFLQRDGLTADGFPILNALCASEDARALPLLIALMSSFESQQARILHHAASRLAGVPHEPQRDAKAWRDWWEQNRTSLPESVRNVALPQFKTGTEALAERLLSAKDDYRLGEDEKRAMTALTLEHLSATLEALWPRETNDNHKTELLQCLLTAWDKSPSARRDKFLLNGLHLGMMDDSEEVQVGASQALFACCFRQFADFDSYLLWRKRSAGKSLAELRRDGLRDFAARFQKAKENEQPGMLESLESLYAYAPTPDREGESSALPNLIAQTAKALDEAGFSVQMLPLLHAREEATTLKALQYFTVFRPDAAWMERNEEELHAAYKRLLAKPGESAPPFSLLLAYHKPWVGELLSDYVQRAYISGEGHNAVAPVVQLHDRRILPLAMALLSTFSGWRQSNILKNVLEQTDYPDDAPTEPAEWRKWWAAHQAEMPEEARAIPFPMLKTGAELVSELLAHSTERDWNLIQMVQELDAETRFKVIHDNWKNIKDETMRWYLILEYDTDRFNGEETLKEMPHFLELLALGASDTSERVRQMALRMAAPLAMREFKETKPFFDWRVQAQNQPLADIVRVRARSLIAAIEKADDKALPDLLEQASHGSWYSGFDSYTVPMRRQRIEVLGRAGITRKIAEEAYLLDYLASRLKPGHTPEVYAATLHFLEVYHPDAAYMDRIAPDVRQAFAALEAAKKPRSKTALNNEDTPNSNILSILNYYNTDWAADILRRDALKQLRAGAESAVYRLMNVENPHLMPLLIAILADPDLGMWVQGEISASLCRMAHIHRDVTQDAAWWRTWWEENRTDLPETVRALTIPTLDPDPQAAKMFSIRRGRKQTQIGADARRRYWLVSSGLLIQPPRPVKPIKKKAGGKVIAAKVAPPKPPAPRPPAGDFPDFPYADRPGLLVVLTDDTDDMTTQMHYWQDMANKGFGGKYLVALAVCPNAKEGQKPRWPTRRERDAVVPFTTETLASEIVRDVRTRYPVNPARVFLLGVGTAGQAAYSASLEPQTPFRGFAILDSAFRMGYLPPLGAAKGRRYILLHDPKEKQPPYFVAKVAAEALHREGAMTRLTPCPQEPDAMHRATWQQIAEALRWLEGAAVRR